jgi:hypothetical protein
VHGHFLLASPSFKPRATRQAPEIITFDAVSLPETSRIPRSGVIILTITGVITVPVKRASFSPLDLYAIAFHEAETADDGWVASETSQSESLKGGMACI